MMNVTGLNLGQNKNKFNISKPFKTPYFDRQPIIRPTAFGDEWAIISEKTRPPQWIKIAYTVAGLLVLWFSLTHRNTEGNPVWFALAGLLAALWYSSSLYQDIQKYQRGKRFGSPILLLEHDRYLPGEALTLAFHRDMLPEIKVEVGSSLRAWLVGMELTRRVQGTDTTLDRVVFHEQELGKKLLVPGTNQLRASWHLQLPDNARPTLLHEGHWVVWLVQVRQSLPGQLEETTDFLIPVVMQRTGDRA